MAYVTLTRADGVEVSVNTDAVSVIMAEPGTAGTPEQRCWIQGTTVYDLLVSGGISDIANALGLSTEMAVFLADYDPVTPIFVRPERVHHVVARDAGSSVIVFATDTERRVTVLGDIAATSAALVARLQHVPLVESGTYVPNVTIVSNLDSITAQEFRFVRVDDIVEVDGTVTVDPTAAGQFRFNVELPFPSDFPDGNVGSGSVVSGLQVVGPGFSEATANELSFSADGSLAVIGFKCRVHFSYRIVAFP
jgi:hypothetical protein